MKPQNWLTPLALVLVVAGGTLSASPASVTVPAGTVLDVRLTEPINVDFATAGATYRSVLDDPVMMHGRVVIPRGARVALQAVAVKQSGRLTGSDKITLKAKSLSFGGLRYDIVTTYVQTKGKSQGKRTAKKVGIGAGLGAAVGGIFGGGSGAAIGAAIGGGTGAVVASQDSEHLTIPPETRLQFQLNAAVTVRP
jgi:YmgG-like glycine-zipper protein